MSFGSKSSKPAPVIPIKKTPVLPKALERDKSLTQVGAASALLADVTNSDDIKVARRKAKVLGPAATNLG